MEGQNFKKCLQKELNWNCSENKKLYTYYYAFPRDKLTPTEAVDIEYHMPKKELIIDFVGQNETKLNTSESLFFYYQLTLKKATENKSERHT